MVDVAKGGLEAGPLFKSYRVLDLTESEGMLCGKVLADIGFDVIKVEPPGGAVARRHGPFFKDVPGPERSLFWLAFNTSKRGITLNLETEDGKEIFKRLVSRSHFVIESFRPGYLDSLGLGYETLSGINERLIVTSISYFGQTGPHKDYKGSDIVAMAEGGFMYACGYPDRAPLRFTVGQSACLSSLQAATGTMIAHYYRMASGKGQHVDVSMQASVANAAWVIPQIWYLNKTIYKRFANKFMRKGNEPQNIWPCKDGHISWMIYGSVRARRTQALVEWMAEENMAGGLDKVDWVTTDVSEVAPEEMARWEGIIGRFFMKYTREELSEQALKRGIMLFPVSTIDTLVGNRQLQARRFWTGLFHPDLGAEITYPGAPFKSTEPIWSLRRPAPHIGEHNKEIYQDEMGFSTAQMASLRQANVI